ncbi:MAG: protein kinase, partial [Deltaproteobacteria bacterium]|nr:protein kinase [Deltaproteobacteria bacterium]
MYERLGVGGMATVHRALERGPDGFERMVALKRLLPHLADDASFIKSFVREAKLASILNHINIVQIYELGRVGAEYFISMEYIDGRDVRRILRHARKVTGPPPIHVTVALMLQLCEALDYAHAKVDEDGTPLKLVHRDVSPSNVIVTSAGHLKIIDFGIAKAESSQLRTQTGRVKGKLAYMAPEAIAGGRDLDARSDLWAVGVILHELLTARPLFASKNEYQTLLKVQKGDIMPPSTFNQGCPPELDAIVFKALARDPNDRFASCGDMREALLEVKQHYSLQTGYRDVAAWLDWAFSLEQPTGFNNQPTTGVSEVDPVHKQVRPKTPRPSRNREEDEAVEMVWGADGGGGHDSGGPLLLDDVPDVSAKSARGDAEDMSGAQASGDLLTLKTPTGEMAPLTMPEPRSPALARGTELPMARGSEQMPSATGSQPKQRPEGPQRPARQTGMINVPKPAGTAAGAQQISRPPGRQTGSINVARTVTGQPRTTPQAISAQRQSDRVPTPPAPSDFSDTEPTTAEAGSPLQVVDSPSSALRHEDLFGDDEHNNLAAADNVATIAQPKQRKETEFEVTTNPAAKAFEPELPVVPVVRFSKTHNVPAIPEAPPPTTVPPPMGTRAPSIPPQNLLKPKSPSQAMPVARVTTSSSRGPWLAIGIGVVLASAAGTAYLVLSARHAGDASAHVTAPTTPREPVITTGTVKFVSEPPDAEITIQGMAPHAGSPWQIDLPAGIHQIEIHRQGYKSWLTSLELSARETQTLRVVLEPLSQAAANVDATLTISTTPAGLDALLDGKPLAEKTPTKTTVKTGSHTISVRQNGVEVWHQQFTAEASSDYEFNPSFTADKQRERAERASAPRKAAPKADEPAPAPPPPPSDEPKPEAPPPAPAPMVAIEKPQPVPAPPAPP